MSFGKAEWTGLINSQVNGKTAASNAAIWLCCIAMPPLSTAGSVRLENDWKQTTCYSPFFAQLAQTAACCFRPSDMILPMAPLLTCEHPHQAWAP